MAKTSKNRVWWFVAYPDSLPPDWKNLLDYEMLPLAVSPLHDRDVNDDGTQKKPHYHILCRYDGPTTYNHVLELTRRFNATIPKTPKSFVAAYEYLTHKNHPDKAQYSSDDIIHMNGFVVPTREGDVKVDVRRDICAFIFKSQITEMYQLMQKALNDPDCSQWLTVIANNSYFFNAQLRSNRYHLQSVQQHDYMETVVHEISTVPQFEQLGDKDE